HAIVPFYGQGMNASFEDCFLLDKLIDTYSQDWETIFQQFQQERKKDADAIADLAVENFYEMRDKVNDIEFQRMRKLEYILENTYPDYHSKYSMVTFHPEISYSQARNKGNKQNEYLLKLCLENEDISKLNYQEIYQEIQKIHQ
ncbi:MAG: FAD-dependent oxidoreductase, partial [Raineya sp.]